MTSCDCSPKQSDGSDPISPPPSLAAAVTAVRRRAFTALLDGDPTRVADIAEAASRDAVGAAQAIAWLENHGALERDGDLLVGAHGLTLRETTHALTIDGRTLHTWCAFDAVAIPIALRASARVSTTCPTCQGPLVIDIVDGHPLDDPIQVLWLPEGPCTNLMVEFCVDANLFCTTEHLAAWRDTPRKPTGRVVALADVAPLALDQWADVALPQPPDQ